MDRGQNGPLLEEVLWRLLPLATTSLHRDRWASDPNRDRSKSEAAEMIHGLHCCAIQSTSIICMLTKSAPGGMPARRPIFEVMVLSHAPILLRGLHGARREETFRYARTDGVHM